MKYGFAESHIRDSRREAEALISRNQSATSRTAIGGQGMSSANGVVRIAAAGLPELGPDRSVDNVNTQRAASNAGVTSVQQSYDAEKQRSGIKQPLVIPHTSKIQAAGMQITKQEHGELKQTIKHDHAAKDQAANRERGEKKQTVQHKQNVAVAQTMHQHRGMTQTTKREQSAMS